MLRGPPGSLEYSTGNVFSGKKKKKDKWIRDKMSHFQDVHLRTGEQWDILSRGKIDNFAI